MFRLFGLLLVGLVLSGCAEMVVAELAIHAASGVSKAVNSGSSQRNTGTSRVKLSDGPLPYIKDKDVCLNAKEQNKTAIQEAKIRGLNCEIESIFPTVPDTTICSRATSKNYDTLSIEWTKHSQRNEFVTEAKRRQLKCNVGSKFVIQNKVDAPVDFMATLKDDAICQNATDSNGWEKSPSWSGYVKEAKRRGLTCGVGETSTTQIASSTTTQSSTPSSAELTDAQKEAERLRQELAAVKSEQEKQQQTKSGDTQIPLITITQSGADGRKGTVKGYAKDNIQIAEVLIDGQPVQLGSNGSFEWSGFVPATGKNITIEAIDTAALSSTKTVSLTRGQIQQASGPRFDDLDPTSGKRVKRNDNALALIVGIADYERTDAPAIYADKDAQFFHDYASLKLGIPDSNITTMVNDKAEQGDVILAVKDWMRRSSKPGKSDVYVFFAGHGLASQDGEEMYLLPYDGRPRLLDKTAILRDELFADISAANPRSVTVFLDTCYSGTTRGTDMLIASRPIAIRALEQSIPDNFTVMTAAAGDQTAKPLEEAKHGMFSYFLMKGMEGEADANNDNEITAGELHSYVQTNVIQQSSGSQTPELQGDADRVLVTFK